MSIVHSFVRVLQMMGDNLIRLIGPLFVMLAVGLTSSVVYVWYMVLFPMHTQGSLVAQLFHSFMAVVLVSNLFYHYYSVVRTSPGYAPIGERANADEDIDAEDEPERGKGFSRFCKKCNVPKPPRSHHCHVCGRCVLRMDHHCPWVHNCVGYHNHRFFFGFMNYMWMGCAYIALLSAAPFSNTSDFSTPWPYEIGRGSVVFCFVLSLSIFLALTFMMTWHFYLIISAQTTIEFYYNRFAASEARKQGRFYVNKYDLGYRRNLALFFGYDAWWHYLIPGMGNPPGDGITYPLCEDARRIGQRI